MKMLTLAFGFAVAMTTASLAMADQCAYITKAQAEKALKAVLETTKVQTLCEPCGESKPQTLAVKSIGIRDVNYQGYWELFANDKGLDLAYTYVNGLNLAKFAGCSANGVSLSIQ